MYSTGQTLRHKTTNALVRLWPLEGSSFDWHSGTREFMGEDGVVFRDHQDNYTHVENELGQPVCGDPPEGEYVDTRLKEHLAPPHIMEQRRNVTLQGLTQNLLKRMETQDHIIGPFCTGGSYCDMFYKYFIQLYPEQKLFTFADPFYDDRTVKIFHINGVYWWHSLHHGLLKIQGGISTL